MAGLQIISSSTLCKRESKANGAPIRLSLGCPILDAQLEGGLNPTGITEICGEAGVGKTQLLLRLLLTAQLPLNEGGLGGRSIYISAEGNVPLKRLAQIAHCIALRSDQSNKGTRQQRNVAQDMLGSVFLFKVHEANDLWELIANSIPVLLQRRNVKLIVLDSIAAVFRSEFGASAREFRERTLWLTSLSSRMRELSDHFGATFVLANQVSSGMNNTLRPALGLTWSNCVNTRIMLKRCGCSEGLGFRTPKFQAQNENTSKNGNGTNEGKGIVPAGINKTNFNRKSGVRILEATPRLLEVVFSPIHRNIRCQYVIKEIGICGLGSL